MWPLSWALPPRVACNSIYLTMAKLSLAVVAALAASASAFAPAASTAKTTALKASEGVWDPMGLYELGSGKAFDTFPNVFPDKQYLQASEIKHGRQAMLAWTGVWATTEVRWLADAPVNKENCV